MMVSIIAAALILTIKLYIHSRGVILNTVTSSWKVQMVLGDNSTEGCPAVYCHHIAWSHCNTIH